MNASPSSLSPETVPYLARAREAFLASEYGQRIQTIMLGYGIAPGDVDLILGNTWDDGYVAACLRPSEQQEPSCPPIKPTEEDKAQRRKLDEWRDRVNAAFEACPSPVTVGRGASFQVDGFTLKVARWLKGWDEGGYWLGWRMITNTGEDMGIGGRDERDPDQTSTEVD